MKMSGLTQKYVFWREALPRDGYCQASSLFSRNAQVSYFLLLINLIFSGCVSNLVKDDVTNPADEIVIYDFANWYLRTQNLHYLYEQATYMVFESKEETQKRFERQLRDMFNSAECNHFMRQYNLLSRLTWDRLRLPNVRFMRKELYHNLSHNYSYWQQNRGKTAGAMSRPLLSADNKTLVVYIEVIPGADCSHGGFEVFTKTEEGWKKVDSNFSTWIE